MCTAISENYLSHLFGRTLDLELSYGERVTIMPRGFDFPFLHEPQINKYAIIGVAYTSQDIPLFFDGMNEHGLAIAGLNFPKCAHYHKYESGKKNLASFEMIPYILRECKNLSEVIHMVENVNITDESFSKSLPSTPMHWLISDKSGALVVEPSECGTRVYQNPFGILTNSPDFIYQRYNLENYLTLSASPVDSSFIGTRLDSYSRGLSAFGLPGDYSSTSRFVKGAFVKSCTDKEGNHISRFFSIMDTIKVPTGVIKTDMGASVSTVYTSCMDTSELIYYYTTNECRQIQGVKLSGDLILGSDLISYKMKKDEPISFIN